MSKKRKKDVYDEAEREGTTLADFVIPQKVTAFIDAYQPVEHQRMATVVFDEAKLRQFFKAYPCSLGDPLTIYLTRLEMEGFRMMVSDMNEPVIFVTEKRVGGMQLLGGL